MPRPKQETAQRTVTLPTETWQKINIIKAVEGSQSVYKVIEDAINEVYAKLKLPKMEDSR